MSKFRYVGNPSLQNVDGADKVSGRAKYVCDMVVPRMLIAKILRSPIPARSRSSSPAGRYHVCRQQASRCHAAPIGSAATTFDCIVRLIA